MLIGLLGAAGCDSPNAEFRFLTDQFEQVSLHMEKGQVRGLLGLPTLESRDRQAWWYVWPAPKPDQPSTGPARPLRFSIFLSFSPQERLLTKELLSYTPGEAATVFRAEVISEESNQSDFSQILMGKLRDLADASDAYAWETQPASFQFRRGEQLLVSGETWSRESATLMRITGRFSGQRTQQLAQAIEVALSIRRFSIGLLFEGATRYR